MATLQFSRNTKVYLVQGTNTWEIPVLDGFSFSQATNASEITLNEMSDGSGNSRRARQMFTDSYAPAEWSFSSYMRPTADDGRTADSEGAAVEEALWANFVANTSMTKNGTTDAWTDSVTRTANDVTFDFEGSNKTTLGTYDLYFVLGACGTDPDSYGSDQTIYKIENCVGNTATISFDIDGIAMIEWSGFGKIITEDTAVPNNSSIITTGALATDTSNFIRNRLTSLTVQAADTTTFPGASSNGTYNVTLTGGSITFENNLTYLTPETLCTINQPLEHVTGTRTISGSFTCYLDGTTGGSEDLFEDVIEALDVVTNSFALNFKVGGSSGTPRVEFNMPKCHLEVPSHSIEDVISLETNFHALPTDVSSADEATIKYVHNVSLT